MLRALRLYILIISVSGTYSEITCPIGFKSIEYKSGKGGLCYRLKDEESFSDSYNNCAGNLYAIELYNNLTIPWDPSTTYIWTQYRSAYPGGPFIDWSYTASTGQLLHKQVQSHDTVDTDTCVVIDSTKQYKSVSCQRTNKRYCFVSPYEEVRARDNRICVNYIPGSAYAFFSPYPTCLIETSSYRSHGTDSVTWYNAQQSCETSGKQLLNFGWIYANHEVFLEGDRPLGFNFDSNHPEVQLRTKTGTKSISPSEWKFLEWPQMKKNYSFALAENKHWVFVDRSHRFSHYICELPLTLNKAMLTLAVDPKGRLVLSVKESVDNQFIMCFTDSEEYYPTKVEFHEEDNIRVLEANNNGYYWCINTDSTNYLISESNKTLYIPNRESMDRVYVAKLKLRPGIKPDLSKISKLLNEYVYLCNTFYKSVGLFNGATENNLNDLMLSQPVHVKEVLFDVKWKKWLKNNLLIWLHFKLESNMLPANNGTWQGIEVLYMKTVQYCSRDKVENRKDKLGKSISNSQCGVCMGVFNEEVEQFTNSDDCKQQEQLLQVMSDLESIVNNSKTVSSDAIRTYINKVNTLLSNDKRVDIPSQLLHILDNIGARLELTGSNASVVKENIALVTAKANVSHPIRAIRIATNETDGFKDHDVTIIRNEINPLWLQNNASEIVVKIPESISVSNEVVSFVLFGNDRAFRRPESEHLVNSKVISIQFGNHTHFKNKDEYVDIYLRPIIAMPGRHQKRVCAYWEFLDNGTGRWSTHGCTLMHSKDEEMMDFCRCTHLTHFAEILIPRTSLSEVHEKLLEFISIVGCFISILGLIVVAITAVVFNSWYRELNNKIWLQLCFSILLNNICFLVIVITNFQEPTISCKIIGIILHYSTLASFCWMSVAAFVSYRKLVVIFTQGSSNKLMKASIFSWGAPCIVIGVLLSVSPHSYSEQFNENLQHGTFCYPTGLSLWLTVHAPIALMLFANWILFVLIVRSLFASRGIQKHGDANETLRYASVSCFLIFLFGLPWLFGLFRDNIVTLYLFTLTATFQGFVLFLFFVPCNKKTRDLWFKKIKQETRKVPIRAQTYPNRSFKDTPSSSREGDTSQMTAESDTNIAKCLVTNDSKFF